MKKTFFTFLILLIVLSNISKAQINCEWAFNPLDNVYPTPAYNQLGSSIVIDNAGNVYVTGALVGSVDFDPGPGTTTLTSAGADDIFIARYDVDGTLVFAKSMGGTSGDQGAGIALDAAGNIYITGLFNGTADFDPGPGFAYLVCSSGADVFFAKYDAMGNYIYAKGLPGSNIDMGISIAADAGGNAYVAGYFWGTVDFDPGTGTANLTGAGRTDAFIGKYDANGNYLLAKKFGSTLNDYANAVAVDASGNIYLVGTFQGTVDFDPGAATVNLTSAGNSDCFIAKYDNSMNYIFAKKVGGSLNDNVSAVKLDASGNIYVTGFFNGTADFDPGAGVVNLVSAGGDDVFIASYDASGNYVYAKSMGGSGTDDGNSLDVDADGNIVVTGFFNGTADFDPGAVTANLTSQGGNDIFIARYDAAGNYVSANSIGGSGDDRGLCLATDASKHIYATGYFNTTADFEPGTGVKNLTSLNSQDMFIAKFGAPEINVQGNALNIADGDVSPDATDGTDFGSTCNSGTFVSTFTILNTGNMTLDITSINVAGTDAAQFTISGAPSNVIAGSSATFDVYFSAGAGGWGVKNASIQINSNDFDEAVYDFALKATVEDNINPTFTCPADQNLCEGYTSLYIAPGNLGDNCFEPVTVTYKLRGATTGTGSDDASNVSFYLGTTMVTYIFADSYGNKDSCMFNVTVNPVYHFIESQEICSANPLTWHGNTYSTAGTYHDNHTSKYGCDSNYTLNLSVIQAVAYYADNDHDGYGAGQAIYACSQPASTSLNNIDCDDTNPIIYPGAPEICDGLDNDCSGTADDKDMDADGYIDAVCGGNDCNDNTAFAHPGLAEVCGDGIDNDCNGTIDDLDADADGYICFACGGDDCDDNDNTIYPGAPELCDNKDNDCDSFIDEGAGSIYYADHDGDGYGNIMINTLACFVPTGFVPDYSDCNDNNPAIHPGAQEIFNGIDEDCSGQADDGMENFMATWGNIQSPYTVTVAKNQVTPFIYGRVYHHLVTPLYLNGGGVGVQAQLGYGPLNSGPASTPGWIWVSGVFNQIVTNNYEFKTTLTPNTPGVYAYAWRYSLNGGYSWLYCDKSGSGDGDPYDVNQQGVMTVVNTTPTLTAVTTLSGAEEDGTFTLTYATLAVAANEADADGDVISFRVESLTSGTLTKGGYPVVPGTTLLGPGESWVWNAGANINGLRNAFTIVAWDGTAVSTPPIQVQINVQAINDPPVVNAGPDGVFDEGQTYSQSGSFTDPDAGDTHTGTVNYGDGTSTSPIAINQLTKTYNLNHIYADNGVYTITVKVMDQQGAIGTDYVTIIVRNIAPVVNAGADATICKGSNFSQSGSFTDPGSDTYTAQVNYGDGSVVQAVAVNHAAKTFNLNHVYTDIGTFTITVTVTDDDGGTGTDYVQVTVNPAYDFTETVTKCSWASYTWRGQNYSTAGVYHDNLQTQKGCDSIYTLILNNRTPVSEICNGIDDDCDGTVDEGVMNQFYTDNDNDGYGTGQVIFACVQPANTSTNNTDCNDNNPNQNVGFYIYADQDNDGYHYGQPILLCSGDPVPNGYSLTTNGMDCNDTDAGVHYGATEICNGKDDDCDGAIDEGMSIITYYADNDADGYGFGAPMNGCIQPQNTSLNNTDCNDNNSNIHPGATEVCGNGLDDDCDGLTDECYTLTVNKTGGPGVGGTVTSIPAGIDCGTTCSYLFPEGTMVTLYATPLNGATFAGWAGACTGSPCTVTMTSNKALSARFTYTVTVTKSGNGTGNVSSSPSGINCGASCSMTFDAGSNITLTATPNAGSVFAGWSGIGCIGTGNCNLWMNENKSGDAQFTCILPEIATPISGPSTVCRDQNIQTYSVLPIPLATSYQWTLPAGCSGFSTTNSIQVTFGSNYTTGNISVRGLNDCGPGLSSNITVTATNPEVTITTSSNPACASSPVIFSAATTNGGTNPGYQWFVNDTLKFTNMASNNRLILHSPFDGNADDISGQGLNGTVYNANLTNDRHGNPNRAYSFNGTDAYIDYGDQDTLNPHFSDITISAWVKKDALSQHSRIYSKGTHGGYQAGYDLMFYGWGSPSKAACIFATGDHEHIAYSNNPVEDLDWHHYAAKISRQGYICLYVDGVIQNDSVYIGDHSNTDIADGTLNAAVGASYSYFGVPNVNEYFYGSIDEIKVFKRALSPAEIQSLFVYNNTSGSEFSYIPKQNDLVKCVVVSDQSCVFSTTATSNIIQMGLVAPPIITPSGPVILQTNGSVQLSVSSSVPNPYYQWRRNGAVINGANLNTYTAASEGWYSCSITGTNCITTDSVHVLIPQVAITTNDSVICQGQSTVLRMEVKGSETGILCGMFNENEWVNLTAPDNNIFTSINFASYGTPLGDCGSFSNGLCHATSSMYIAQNACLGRNSCSFGADNGTFGDPCEGTFKRFYVEAEYSDISDINIDYQWSTGDTSAAINVAPQLSGWVYCTVTVGSEVFKDSVYITVTTSYPDDAGAISGSDYVTPGQTETYTVPLIANATSYYWLLNGQMWGSSVTNSISIYFGYDYTGGSITVMGVNDCGNGYYSNLNINARPPEKTLWVRFFLEGLYAGNATMNQAQGASGPQYTPGVADRVGIELRNSTAPYDVVWAQYDADLGTDGNVQLAHIPGVLNEAYYIVIRHRNSIETWSAQPLDIIGTGPFSYDFSTAASQAYGNNQKLMGGVYVIWGGDATQDGMVDGSDMSVIDNGSQPPILHGYYPEDVNGDGIVDGSDMSMVDNNSAPPPVSVKRP